MLPITKMFTREPTTSPQVGGLGAPFCHTWGILNPRGNLGDRLC